MKSVSRKSQRKSVSRKSPRKSVSRKITKLKIISKNSQMEKFPDDVLRKNLRNTTNSIDFSRTNKHNNLLYEEIIYENQQKLNYLIEDLLKQNSIEKYKLI